MAVVYWVHLPEHTDMFSQGYIGVTPDLKKRIREHKHKFKNLWDRIIVKTVLISDLAYCYMIEKKLRPIKNIGWNKAVGGYRNNTMLGQENPNYGKCGEKASNFKGWYITPKGKFATPFEAAKEFNVSPDTIRRRCKGIGSNGKPYLYLEVDGKWEFEKKVEV